MTDEKEMPLELLLGRLSSMVRFLREGNRNGEYFWWDDVYCWDDWSDYVWELLLVNNYFGLYTRLHEHHSGETMRQVMVGYDEDRLNGE